MDAQLTSSRDGGGVVLEQVTAALRVEGSDFSRLDLKVAGRRASLAIQQDTETRRARGLRLSVAFEGLQRAEGEDDDVAPSILLRRETAADESDKARDLTREVQVGYEKFDHAVFIDNDSSEADVRRILSKEATRQAVLRLLEAGFVVRVSVRQVTATRSLAAEEKRLGAQPVLDALEDLLIVSRAGGPKAGERPGRRGSSLLWGASAVLALSLIYAWAVHANWPASIGLAIFGLVVAGAVAIFSRPAIEAACSGDSGSGPRSRNLIGAFSTAAGALVFGAILHVNGALDSAPPQVRRGVVISVPLIGERADGATAATLVRWEDGSTSNVNKWLEWTRFGLNERVVEYVHPGALGFTWRTTDSAQHRFSSARHSLKG